MSASTRRGFVAALLGMGLMGARPFADPPSAEPQGLLRLPESSLRLTRTLERGQGEGGTAAITVRRWWDVSFRRQGRGTVVTGRQIGAKVDAPPYLAELARIEQQRDASGMFPLMLSENGAILTAPTAPVESDTVAAALRAAEGFIARQPLPADDRARALFYLAEVHRAGSGLLDALPGDLFYPAGIPVERSEVVALPNGLTGLFVLSYKAVPQPGAPWLARAERRVITSVSAMERQAAEVWTLEPI
jgi:hypothetical protein